MDRADDNAVIRRLLESATLNRSTGTARLAGFGMECNKARIVPFMLGSFIVFVLFIFPQDCFAQRIRAAVGPAAPRVTSTPEVAHNSMARDTTPFNCEQYAGHPHPTMMAFCEGMEADLMGIEAKRAGRPAASRDVLDLPGVANPGSRDVGSMVCIGGQAMRRIAGGWDQVLSPSGGWQRCRER